MSTDADLISWLRRTPLYDSTGDSVDDRPDEAADRMEALIAERDRLAPIFRDLLAHMAGAASAYREHAARSSAYRPKATPDAFFATRVHDFDRCVERARAALSPTQEKGE